MLPSVSNAATADIDLVCDGKGATRLYQITWTTRDRHNLNFRERGEPARTVAKIPIGKLALNQ